MYRLNLISAASKDMEKEFAYSARKWGGKHAVEYIEGLERKLEATLADPFIYPVRIAARKGIRIIAYKGNRIFYVVEPSRKEVIVLGILSIYQDINKILSRLN